jgi:hypothetical protein
MEKHDLDETKWFNLLLWLQKHGMDISEEKLPVEYRYFSGVCAIGPIRQN